jgi:hypothetical protein
LDRLAICLDFPIGVLIALSSTPVEYKLMLTYPAITLAASMASRVFRISKEPTVRDGLRQTMPISDVNFAHNPRHNHAKSTFGVQESVDVRTRNTAQLSSTLPSHSHDVSSNERTITIVFPEKKGTSEVNSEPDGCSKDTSSSTFNADKSSGDT